MRKIWVLLGLSLLMGIFACARTTTTTTTPTTTSSTTTTTTTTTSTSTTTSSTTTTTAFLILFEENGGSAVADYTSSSQLSQLPVTTRTGFTFSGWYIDPECTVVFNPETPRTDWTFTLYAGWTPLEQVTVTFESNGGSPVFSWIMYSGDTLTFPTNPVKTGYSFGGWYSEPELTTVYVPAALSESITLYARWIPAQVNVTVERYLEGLDGIYVKTETASMLRYTEALAEAPLLPQTGFTVNPSHPAAVLSGTVAPDGSLVLKVYYDRNDYTIAFEANADLSIRSITLAYGSPVTKPSDPIRAGFSFLGWFSDPDKTLPYSFTTMPAANIIVYAKWLGDPATLAFDSHGGSAVSNIVAPRESGIDSPTDPVRDGFLFDGWFTDSGYTDPFTVWVMPNANLTLHAKWIPVEFSIVFEENGGSAVSDLSAPFQSVIQAPSDPV
ncbi:MAG TPA: InlB B-repeat-containing protein, partial [Candidatus Izemoplasmatales bacterium]|nr:InlB B-repeat-containing protein [Candidatus Izemoplasmatales bacterium]